jgi:hypothetical protein
LGIAGLSLWITGWDVFVVYYTKLLPRILDGYVNYPYSAISPGIIVFLRKIGQFDAVLNPAPVFHWSPVFIGVLNALLILPFLLLVLRKAEQSSPLDGRSWLAIFVLFNLSSGYNSVYALLLPALFCLFLEMRSKRDWAIGLLVVCITLLPAQLLENTPLLIQYSKLGLTLVLLLLLIFPISFRDLFTPSLVVLSFLFLSTQVLRILRSDEEPRYTYFHPEIWKAAYVLDYWIQDDSLFASTWGKDGAKQVSMKLAYPTRIMQEKDPSYSIPTITSSGILVKKKLLINDTVLFLSDAGRGVGLYHLFCMPIRRAELKAKP